MSILKKWQCCECDTLHKEKWDAEDCCAPTVKEVYACPACDKGHSKEVYAANCCDENSPAAITAMALELEKHGQQRLIA